MASQGSIEEIGFKIDQRLGKDKIGDIFNMTDIRILRPADIGFG